MEFTHTRPKANKRHRCMTCWRTIEPGETYLRGAGFDCGTAWTYKTCAHCEAIVDLYRAAVIPDEGYSDETFRDWADGNTDEWRTPTPAEYAFRLQYLMQWKDADGVLFPIPQAVAA